MVLAPKNIAKAANTSERHRNFELMCAPLNRGLTKQTNQQHISQNKSSIKKNLL